MKLYRNTDEIHFSSMASIHTLSPRMYEWTYRYDYERYGHRANRRYILYIRSNKAKRNAKLVQVVTMRYYSYYRHVSYYSSNDLAQYQCSWPRMYTWFKCCSNHKNTTSLYSIPMFHIAMSEWWHLRRGRWQLHMHLHLRRMDWKTLWKR